MDAQAIGASRAEIWTMSLSSIRASSFGLGFP
jgi:hypothetical protein